MRKNVLKKIEKLMHLCTDSMFYYFRCTNGFTLIELVISLAIAAIVGVSLTMLLNQSYVSQRKFESLTHINSRIALFFTQLERDLMGATVPIENILTIQDQRKKKDTKKETSKNESQKTIQENNKQDEQKTEEPPYKAFEKVFYCMQQKPRFVLSWISRDPLQLYWGSSVGMARPRIARIMYRLEQNPSDKTTFRLMRSEGSDLTYTPYEKHADQKYKGDLLIDDIRSITVTCISIQEKKDEKAIPQKNAESKKDDVPPVFEVKKLSSWEWPQSEKENQKNTESPEQELPPLPHGIHIKMVLWDDASQKEITFESAIAIPSIPTLDRTEKKQPIEEKKQDQKPESASPETQPTGTRQADRTVFNPTNDRPRMAGIPIHNSNSRNVFFTQNNPMLFTTTKKG